MIFAVSKSSFTHVKQRGADLYFKKDLKEILEGKHILELGSNHGGAALAYFKLYKPKSITGIDITLSQAKTSKIFFKRNGINSGFNFVTGYAEELPFPSRSFDAIISFDVFEHVKNVSKAMSESYRVLRENGTLLVIFPSYYHPTQNHLGSVTKAPFIPWFFSPKDIMETFWDVLDNNPQYRDYIGIRRRTLESWEKTFIINGITLRRFKKIICEKPWSKVKHIPVRIGSAGKVVSRPLVNLLGWISYFGTKLPILEEIVNQRVVYILNK